MVQAGKGVQEPMTCVVVSSKMPRWAARSFAPGLGSGHRVVSGKVLEATMRKIRIRISRFGLGVKCMTPFEMLQQGPVRFVGGERT